MNSKTYEAMMSAWNAVKADEGYTTVQTFLSQHAEYGLLDKEGVARRARQISNACDLFIGTAKDGSHVMTGKAIRLAAEGERDFAHRVGETRYFFIASENNARARRAATERPFLAKSQYTAILALFKRKGSSFDAWAVKSGFCERKARHAVMHPEWQSAEYTQIRKALRAALAELGVQTDL